MSNGGIEDKSIKIMEFVKGKGDEGIVSERVSAPHFKGMIPLVG